MPDATEPGPVGRRIWLFGNFGSANLGNDATLEVFRSQLQQRIPGDQFCAICVGPAVSESQYHIPSRLMEPTFLEWWAPTSLIGRLLRSLVLGVPSELYRWLRGLSTFRKNDVLVILGTGILTDAFGLTGWGPFRLFQWCTAARLRGCKVLFVSIGVGPLYYRLGKFFARKALALASFRSFRDEASRAYVSDIGFRNNDPVYPDVVFSLPGQAVSPAEPALRNDSGAKMVVGLGVMHYSGRYSSAIPTARTFPNYLRCLADFSSDLLAKNCAIRILIGDLCDQPIADGLREELTTRGYAANEERFVSGGIRSGYELLAQIGQTDFVIATRFHNVLSALLAEKPVIAISFHSKVTSLMAQAGLSEYCLDINTLSSAALLSKFNQMVSEADDIRPKISQYVRHCRSELEAQYEVIATYLA